MNEIEGYKFYNKLDSSGYDIVKYNDKTIQELKEICDNMQDAVGFNTIGYIKHKVKDVSEFKTPPIFASNNSAGLYVKNEHVNPDGIPGYTLYKGLDSNNYDLIYYPNKTIEELKNIADMDINVAAFNTLGYLKYKTRNGNELTNFGVNSLYVKNNANVNNQNKRLRIKMICNWCSSYQLCNEWNHMSKGNYTWNNIEITWDNNDIDFFVIINKPPHDYEFFVPERTIIFHMEPWCGDNKQSWGVKTWGKWANPDEKLFLQVRSHVNFYNNAFWQLRTSYNEFKTNVIHKGKNKVLSTICSSKYFDPGHIKRIDFIKYLDQRMIEPGMYIDIYNHDNNHKFKNYVGPHPPGNKDVGIMPYKYYFMAENNIEHNFITEKIWEPLLCECLCFYWGCPNLPDYIDNRAYILLDLDNFEESYNVVRTTIINNEWEKRLEIIRREKQKVLDYYQFFPTIERVIEHDFKLSKHMLNDEIKYNKYFHQILDIGEINNICFVHNFNNQTPDIIQYINSNDTYLFDAIYVVNYGEQLTISNNNKIKVINLTGDVSDTSINYERLTINLMDLFARYNLNSKILYLNNPTNITENSWVSYMLYFLFEKAIYCTFLLDEYDTIGVDFREENENVYYYMNNHFWTCARYLNRRRVALASEINKINENISNNLWLLQDEEITTPNIFVLFESGTNVNDNSEFYKTYYDTDVTYNGLNSFTNNTKKYKTLCVNLLRRPDRKENMIKLFEQQKISNYEFFEAVDGTKLEITDDIYNMFLNNDFGSKRGAIGCALSHLTIWKNLLKDTENDFYFVCEDDIEVANLFKTKLDILILCLNNTNEWDLLHLGYSMFNNSLYANFRKYRNNEISKIIPLDTNIYIGGTFGYIINKSGAQKLVDFINKNGIKHGIDYLAKRYNNDMNLIQFEASPHIIFSEWVQSGNTNVDSDIQRDNVALIPPNGINTVQAKPEVSCTEIYDRYLEPIFNKLDKKKLNICFFHSCTINNNTIVLFDMLNLIKKSDLLEKLDYLFIINFGDNIAYPCNKIKVINYSSDISMFEKPTINLLNYTCRLHDFNVLYLHTKGITHTNYQQIVDWRNYMLYFVVEQFETCLDALNEYDTVGVNYLEQPRKHFSGNFWWSKSSHIKNLDPITSDVRHDCEWWIMTKENKYKNLFSSGLDHYHSLFPRSAYAVD